MAGGVPASDRRGDRLTPVVLRFAVSRADIDAALTRGRSTPSVRSSLLWATAIVVVGFLIRTNDAPTWMVATCFVLGVALVALSLYVPSVQGGTGDATGESSELCELRADETGHRAVDPRPRPGRLERFREVGGDPRSLPPVSGAVLLGAHSQAGLRVPSDPETFPRPPRSRHQGRPGRDVPRSRSHREALRFRAAAFAHCEERARSHYENFPVGLFVPRSVDPTSTPSTPLRDRPTTTPTSPRSRDSAQHASTNGKPCSIAAAEGQADHPVFVALAETMSHLQIPKQPLLDLLSAFRQDTVKRRYATWEELLDYCRRSADPVGRLVLLVFDENAPGAPAALRFDLHGASIGEPLARRRPRPSQGSDLRSPRSHGAAWPRGGGSLCTPNGWWLPPSHGRARFARARALRGRTPPLDRVSRRLRFEMRLTWIGGSSILDRIEEARLRCVWPSSAPRCPGQGGSGLAGLPVGLVSETLSARLTRESGTSFYHAFRILPLEKREAIYAFYTFCRTVDDCVDESGRGGRGWSCPVDGRGGPLLRRRAETRLGRELSLALSRYPIPRSVFAEIVEGCRMDLTISRYETEQDLLVYCRRVASAVGLGCIEIFGYRDPATREYAVELGLALQLTNIVRDVAADAARGRLYLPLADVRRFGLEVGDIFSAARETGPARRDEVRCLLSFVAGQAEGHYQNARRLLPREDCRSLLAAEIMGAIYHALLVKIRRSGYPLAGPRTRLCKVRGRSASLSARRSGCAGGSVDEATRRRRRRRIGWSDGGRDTRRAPLRRDPRRAPRHSRRSCLLVT